MIKQIFISLLGSLIGYALIITGTADAFFNKFVAIACVSLMLLQSVSLFLMHDKTRTKIYIPVLWSMLSLFIGLILYADSIVYSFM